MKEKNTNVTENGNSIVKKTMDFLKANIVAVSITAFCIVAAAVLLTAVSVLQEYIVSVCILIVLEAAMAALLHKVEVWRHGVLLAAQLVVAAVLQRIPLAVLCVVVYVAAIAALQFMSCQDHLVKK